METFLIAVTVIVGIVILVFLWLIIAAYKRRIKFTNKGFTILEHELLLELQRLFDLKIQNKLKNQIEYFEALRKWRQFWDKIMSIELYGDEDNPISAEFLYNRNDESKLATIHFKAKDKQYKIEFENYKGRLWGWKIKPNPKKIMNFSSINIVSKKINTDPNSCAHPKFKKEKFEELPVFNDFISQLNEIKEIKEAFKPMNHFYLENYIKSINSKLPIEYLNIINQTEGIDFGEFRILGISEIYSSTIDDGNYYHLVEFEDGIITVKEGDEKGELYFCHYSGVLDKVGTDFKKILLQKIE